MNHQRSILPRFRCFGQAVASLQTEGEGRAFVNQMKIPNHPRFVDITGKRFGRWTVLEFAEAIKYGSRKMWLCRCDCGVEKRVNGTQLKSGGSVSCGCYRKQCGGITNLQHGMSKSGTYFSWKSMIARCTNPKIQNYKMYGGRGIKVCHRWMKFANFLADMGIRPQGKTLDRFPNPNGNYESENCRWATPTEQTNNRSYTHWITFNGETLNVKQWSERLGIKHMTLHGRVSRGWSIERAFNHPVRRRRP